MPQLMTKAERESLLKICRLRTKVAKADVITVAAERKAEFEKQLATIYSFDDDKVWEEAMATAMAAYHRAQETVDARCRELGIPKEFAPSMDPPGWSGRGENAVAKRRSELRRVADTKIDLLAKQANFEIEWRSAETQTKLLESGCVAKSLRGFW